MDLNAFDFDLDLENESDLADLADFRRSGSAIPTATASRIARSLTNSPGCAPAPVTPTVARVLRKVRTDAWSSPASTSWARPNRTLRKVARRAVEGGGNESA